MSWFHKAKRDSDEDASAAYDFAKMVKSVREKDPGRFAKLQAAFKRSGNKQPKQPGGKPQ